MEPILGESLGTQMVGVLSVALGLVAVMKIPVIWFGISCVGQEIDAWLKPPPASLAVALPQPDASFERYCGIAIAGQFLGVIGARLAIRMKGAFSRSRCSGWAMHFRNPADVFDADCLRVFLSCRSSCPSLR